MEHPGPAIPPKTPLGLGTIGESTSQSRTDNEPAGGGHAGPVEDYPRGQTNSDSGGVGRMDLVEVTPPSRDTVSPTSSQYTGSGYYSRPVTYFNPATAPPNPNQTYDPYYQYQPPKSDYVYYGGPSAVATPAPTPAPEPAPKKGVDRKVCGMSMTAFLLWCVVAFLVISGAICGGVFGSGVIEDKSR